MQTHGGFNVTGRNRPKPSATHRQENPPRSETPERNYVRTSRWRQAMADMRTSWAICRSVISDMALGERARSAACLRRQTRDIGSIDFGWRTIGRLNSTLTVRDSWLCRRPSHDVFRYTRHLSSL